MTRRPTRKRIAGILFLLAAAALLVAPSPTEAGVRLGIGLSAACFVIAALVVLE